MKARFHIPLYLQPFADGQPEVQVAFEGGTVKDALDALFARHRGLQDRVVNEQQQVRQHINIFVADEAIRFTGGLPTPVTENVLITILPAVSGGR